MTLSMLTIEGTWRDISGAPLARAVTMTAMVQTPADHVISDEALNRILGLSRICQTDPDGMARVQVVKAPGVVYRVVFGGVEGHLRCDDWDDDTIVPFVAIKDVPGGDAEVDPLTWDAVISGLNGRIAAQVAPVVEDYFTAHPPLDMVIDGAVEDYLTAHPVTAEAISGGVDLDNAPLDRVAYTAGAGGGAWADLHYPANVAGVVPTYRLVNGSDSHAVQTFTSREPTPRMWTRGKTSGTWGAWQQIGPGDFPRKVLGAGTDADSLTDVPMNTIAQTSGGTANTPAAVGVLMHYGVNTSTAYGVQMFISSTNRMWTRYKTANAWGAWVEIGPGDFPRKVLGAGTDADSLTDVPMNTIAQTSGGTANTPAAVGVLMHYGVNTSTAYGVQMFISSTNRMWTRYKTANAWGAWVEIGPGDFPRKVLGAGTDADSLTDVPMNTIAQTSGGTANTPAAVGVLMHYGVNTSTAYGVQMFISSTNRMWTRYKTANAWGAWTLVGPSSASAGTITGTTDLDTLPVGSTMGTAGPAASPGWVALHYPVLAVGSITTTGLTDDAAHVVQTFTTDTGTMYVRRRTSGTWGAWTQVGKSALPASYGAIDLNTLTRGTRQAYSGAFTNGPAGMAAGMVETTAIQDNDTYLLQVATEWTYADVPGRIWTRRKSNTTWGAWGLIGPVDTSLYPKLPAVRTASGFKAPRCPITLGHNTSGSAPVTNGAVRLPIRWGAKPTRIRPIIADVDIRAGIRSTTADIVITGVWVAAYDESTGAVSNLTQISAGGTIPAGGDWVGTWAPFPAAITGDAWCLIYGYTGTPACQNRGFAQQHTDPAQAGTTSTGWTTTMNAPFAVSLDVEVPNGTPVVMYVGDSLLCGQGATKGTFEGIASVHARSIKAIPVLACSAGDTVQGMTTFTAYKWSRFAGMASPDAVLLEAGVNDIGNGTTADALQGYTATLVTWLAQQYGPVHLSTITPREGASASQKAERAAYNTWLRSAPLGVRDVHDVTLTMQQPGDPDLLVDAYDAGDGLHFTTAGHAAYAAAISRPLTSPPVAYQAVV